MTGVQTCALPIWRYKLKGHNQTRQSQIVRSWDYPCNEVQTRNYTIPNYPFPLNGKWVHDSPVHCSHFLLPHHRSAPILRLLYYNHTHISIKFPLNFFLPPLSPVLLSVILSALVLKLSLKVFPVIADYLGFPVPLPSSFCTVLAFVFGIGNSGLWGSYTLLSLFQCLQFIFAVLDSC